LLGDDPILLGIQGRNRAVSSLRVLPIDPIVSKIRSLARRVARTEEQWNMPTIKHFPDIIDADKFENLSLTRGIDIDATTDFAKLPNHVMTHTLFLTTLGGAGKVEAKIAGAKFVKTLLQIRDEVDGTNEAPEVTEFVDGCHLTLAFIVQSLTLPNPKLWTKEVPASLIN
jgi:hypothetical protein